MNGKPWTRPPLNRLCLIGRVTDTGLCGLNQAWPVGTAACGAQSTHARQRTVFHYAPMVAVQLNRSARTN